MDKSLIFVYENWQGEISTRKAIPKEIWFGSTEYHSNPQWFLKAYDIDKQAERDFAMVDILHFVESI